MKGIILAAGKGTRLYPATIAMSKPMLPVYDRPMIYYPMAVLMSMGIRDIMIITSTDDIAGYTRLFGDGSQLGIHVSYAIQNRLRGIADAFIIAQGFIGDDDVCLALGDNIFLGDAFFQTLDTLERPQPGALVFGYPVEDPRPFGVVEFDENNNVVSLEEKPEQPKSNYIVPGLYFYDNTVSDIAAHLPLSARGELEITDVNRVYLERKQLKVQLIDPATQWFDAGSAEGLLVASNAVAKQAKILEQKQAQEESSMNYCIEAISFRQGFIDRKQLEALAEPLTKTSYGKRILSVLEE